MVKATKKKDIHYLKILFDPGENGTVFQQKLAGLFPAVIYVYDVASSAISFINNKITDLLGYTENDLKQFHNDILALVALEDKELVKKEIEKATLLKDESVVSYRCRFIHKNGESLHFQSEGTVLKKDDKNKIVSLLFVAHDVTQNVLSEQGIKATNELLTEAEEQVHSPKALGLLHYKELTQEKERFLNYGSWEYSFEDDAMKWSDGMYLLFDYDIEKERPAIIDTEKFYYQHMSHMQMEAVKNLRKRLIESSDKDYTWEYEITTQKNNTKKIESYGKVICDASGKPVQVFGISRDITFIKQYEKNLESKLEELKRSNKDLEEFAYVASHDLQEPLRKLTTFNERLRHKFSGILDADANGYLTRMTAATQNMRLLIDNLLEFSRISRSTGIFVKTNLDEIITTVKNDQELLIEETGTIIKNNGLPSVEAIPSQMCQLFNNLLGNAIKFRHPLRKSIITISSEPLSISEKERRQLSKKKNYVKIIVEDNGIGFEEEYAEKVFQLFQRLHAKVEYAGSGIGLSICKKIVENHKGIIYAESMPGKGSAFFILLPETN
jgi:PAS domain S-box-containing protein